MRTWKNGDLLKLLIVWCVCFVLSVAADRVWVLGVAGMIGLAGFFVVCDPLGAVTWRGVISLEALDDFFGDDAFFFFLMRGAAYGLLAILLPALCIMAIAQNETAKRNAAAAESQVWLDTIRPSWRKATPPTMPLEAPVVTEKASEA